MSCAAISAIAAEAKLAQKEESLILRLLLEGLEMVDL
jgi:hypothetical protein